MWILKGILVYYVNCYLSFIFMKYVFNFLNKIIWIWIGGFFFKNKYLFIIEKKLLGYIYSDYRYYECVFIEMILLLDKYVLFIKCD